MEYTYRILVLVWDPDIKVLESCFSIGLLRHPTKRFCNTEDMTSEEGITQCISSQFNIARVMHSLRINSKRVPAAESANSVSMVFNDT